MLGVLCFFQEYEFYQYCKFWEKPVGFHCATGKSIITDKYELLILCKIRALYRGFMDKQKKVIAEALHAQQETDLKAVKCRKNIPLHKNRRSKQHTNRVRAAECHSTHASSSRFKQPQVSFSYSPTDELCSLGQLTLFSGL